MASLPSIHNWSQAGEQQDLQSRGVGRAKSTETSLSPSPVSVAETARVFFSTLTPLRGLKGMLTSKMNLLRESSNEFGAGGLAGDFI